MATDIFQNNHPASEPFTFIKAGKIKITGIGDTTNLLAIGFQWNYTQQQTPVFIIGSEEKILTENPGEGTINISHIVSNVPLKEIIPAEMFNDGNTGKDITIDSTDGGNSVSKTFVNCSVISLGGMIQSDGPYMQSQISIRFSHIQGGK